VLTGATLDRLETRVRERVAAGDPGDQPSVPPYPPPLADPYARRRDDMGARRYGAVGVARDDRAARARVRAGSWECFRAEEVGTCPQIAWAEYHATVAEVIQPPGNPVPACGLPNGYADPGTPGRGCRAPRCPTR
jgi:hypothetical protein